jgi:hypothetical protein
MAELINIKSIPHLYAAIRDIGFGDPRHVDQYEGTSRNGVIEVSRKSDRSRIVFLTYIHPSNERKVNGIGTAAGNRGRRLEGSGIKTKGSIVENGYTVTRFQGPDSKYDGGIE